MANLKKSVVIILVMIGFLTSCVGEGDKIYEEYYNVNSFTQTYKVLKASWNLGQDDDSGYYQYYEFSEPNLTKEIYDYGIMQAFLFMNGNNITPLPFDDFWMDGDIKWTEQVTCEFRPGYVTFILKYDDHAVDIPPHYDYTFMVRFLW